VTVSLLIPLPWYAEPSLSSSASFGTLGGGILVSDLIRDSDFGLLVYSAKLAANPNVTLPLAEHPSHKSSRPRYRSRSYLLTESTLTENHTHFPVTGTPIVIIPLGQDGHGWCIQ
jgi:hypothetical protein